MYLKNIFNLRGNPTPAQVLLQLRGACRGEPGHAGRGSQHAGAWRGQRDPDDFHRRSQGGELDSLPLFRVSCSRFTFLSPVPCALSSIPGPGEQASWKQMNSASPAQPPTPPPNAWAQAGRAGRSAKNTKTKVKVKKGQTTSFCEDSWASTLWRWLWVLAVTRLPHWILTAPSHCPCILLAWGMNVQDGSGWIIASSKGIFFRDWGLPFKILTHSLFWKQSQMSLSNWRNWNWFLRVTINLRK